MWASFRSILFLTFVAQRISSSSIVSRQEQCQSAANDSARAACDMQAAFGGSSIIPQLLPNFSPKAGLSVRYNNVVIGGAQQMSPSKVSAQPFLSLSFISNNTQVLQQMYVIVALEFQSQSQSITPFWIQPAVKIDASNGDMTSSVPPILPYSAPNPSQGSGTNEYIFLVFQDPGLVTLFKQNVQLTSSISMSFQFQNFIQATGLANPIAVSYFKSTFDGLPINGQSPAAVARSQAKGGTTVSPTVLNNSSSNQTASSNGSQKDSASNNSSTVVMRPISTGDTGISSQSLPQNASTQTNSSSQEGEKASSSPAIDLGTQMYFTTSVAIFSLGLICG